MKRILSLITAVFTLAAISAHAQDTDQVTRALAAAQSWLALTDSKAYAQSWDQSAALFQAGVSKPNWITAIQGARAPLGNLKSRTVKSASFTHTLPGAPDGEYVVIQYDTQFEHKAGAIETVTPLHEKDGSWRVSGYFIK
jgi:hypothetical protein